MCSTFSSAVKCPSRGKSWMSVLLTCSVLPAPASHTATSEMPKVMLSKPVVQMWSDFVKLTVNQVCICADRLSFCVFLWLFSLTLIFFNLSLWCLFPPQVWELQLQSSFIPVVSPINQRSDGLLYPDTRASAEGGARFPRSNVLASRSLVPVQYGGVYFFLFPFFTFIPSSKWCR